LSSKFVEKVTLSRTLKEIWLNNLLSSKLCQVLFTRVNYGIFSSKGTEQDWPRFASLTLGVLAFLLAKATNHDAQGRSLTKKGVSTKIAMARGC